jgi:crotonobetainyl-CoA:carnitine CoA-transferase CaiB-like acyl-CoA transferase
VKTTLFPFTLDGQRPGVRLNPPRRGEHTREVLAGVGMTPGEIDALIEAQAVA